MLELRCILRSCFAIGDLGGRGSCRAAIRCCTTAQPELRPPETVITYNFKTRFSGLQGFNGYKHFHQVTLPIVRNNVFDLFQLLDFPDPAVSTGNRVTTVVASQALLMLNRDFVMQAATDFADRLLNDSPIVLMTSAWFIRYMARIPLTAER